VDKQIGTTIVAMLASIVIACGGSTGVSAAGRSGSGGAGNATYLTADDTFGVAVSRAIGEGLAGAMSDSAQGPQLQP
jgi:hypothetical protein